MLEFIYPMTDPNGAAIYGNIYHQYTPFMLVYIYTSTMDPSWVHDLSGLVPEFDSLNQWGPKIRTCETCDLYELYE